MTTAPSESFVSVRRGREDRLRILTWGEGRETVLFLHGLSGVAEVWEPTVSCLPPGRRYVAVDQRGHGQSVVPDTGYSANRMTEDVRGLIGALGGRVHLVGHSMGARIALMAASRHPELLATAAVVDIGPEASRANIESTVRGISSRPERFASRAEALAFAFRTREPTERDIRLFLARLEPHPDGSLTWRASREALTAIVTSHRSRNYWAAWRGIALPALFIHGGASNEVSTAIADRMRRENPRVQFERFEGVGHNIPLIAPERLAESLERFWTTASKSAT